MVDVFVGIEETLNDYCRSCIFKETSTCIKIQCPILYKLTSYGKVLDPKGFEVQRKPTMKYINRPWTEEEIAMLKKYVGKRRLTEIAKMLNRPYSSVNNRVRRMRVRGEL